jgi:hypothetical protein
MQIEDKWPSKHRIRTIRDETGLLLGFGTTAPGGKTIVYRFQTMGQALAKLNETCDFIYGPMWRPRESVQ